MKKGILLAVAIMTFGFANAQEAGSGFSKGDVFITGSVGVGSVKNGDQKFSAFEFSPKAGYFVSENIALGLAVGVLSTKDDNGVNRLDKDNTTSFGAFGRYYFTPGSQFSVFGQLGFNINSTKSTTEITTGNVTTTTEGKSNGYNVGLAPGVSYFISKHFALEAAWGILNFASDKPDVAGAEATTSVDFGLNLNPFSENNLGGLKLGLVYKF